MLLYQNVRITSVEPVETDVEPVETDVEPAKMEITLKYIRNGEPETKTVYIDTVLWMTIGSYWARLFDEGEQAESPR